MKAYTGSKLNMGKLPAENAAKRVFGEDAKYLDDVEKRNAASMIRSGKFTDEEIKEMAPQTDNPLRKSKNMKKGGKVSSASKRADGIAVKGKTRGRMV